MSSTGRTVKFFGLARSLKGGATKFDYSKSEYNAKMKYLSASIFGDFKKPHGSYNNHRLMWSMIGRPLYERPEIIQYYPAHEQTAKFFYNLRAYGLFRDEHKDFVEEMEKRRNKRGKYKISRPARGR